MSTTLDPTNALQTRDAARPEAASGRFSKLWVVIACLLLGISGGVRVTQDRRHGQEKGNSQVCPIALSKISTTLGDWHYVEGSDQKLPELTMRITGGTDHLIRAYTNDLTGVSLMVLILYGPAEQVLPHTPEVCYPAGGFIEGDAAVNRTIVYSPDKPEPGRSAAGRAIFRSASYFKPSGRVLLREAAYHSFRLDDQWNPDVALSRAAMRRNPGIFKIQIQRQMTEWETLGKDDPVEQFLGKLLGEIENKLAATSPPVTASR